MVPTGTLFIYLFNYRDIQEIKNRKVFFYDREKSCVPYKDPKAKETGHWEKVVKDVDRYFFVKGAKPSQVPNSFVVSKDEAELGDYSANRITDRYRLNNLN